MESETPPTPEPAAPLLNFEEARVLGCLFEKEQTTPEYYPLSLNQVTQACNQSSNRDPVVAFSEGTVQEALEGLKKKRLAYQVTLQGARVQKYKHALDGKFPRLEKPTMALLCVLLLRGQQTIGELRQRTERLHAFPHLGAVESTLKELIEYPESPLAIAIPPGGGRKTVTYTHLLCGPPDVAQAPPSFAGPTETNPRPPSSVDLDWKERMEGEIASLRAEVAQLREMLDTLVGKSND